MRVGTGSRAFYGETRKVVIVRWQELALVGGVGCSLCRLVSAELRTAFDLVCRDFDWRRPLGGTQQEGTGGQIGIGGPRGPSCMDPSLLRLLPSSPFSVSAFL